LRKAEVELGRFFAFLLAAESRAFQASKLADIPNSSITLQHLFHHPFLTLHDAKRVIVLSIMVSHQLAIAKATFAASLLRPDSGFAPIPRDLVSEFHTLLDATIAQCSPANVQVCFR
jgi:hypothetical protein